MSRVLIYFPSPYRTISIESLMEEFTTQGHEVYLLTTCEEGDFHKQVKLFGAKVFTYVIPKNNFASFYTKHILFLVSFCRKHDIDIVFSHIQQCNLAAIIAQYFIKASVIMCRHHSNIAYVNDNKKEQRADHLINFFAKSMVLPSGKVLQQVVEVEKANPGKTHLIPYGYNFDRYDKPDSNQVEVIRQKFQAQLLLICLSRLVPGKGFMETMQAVNKLIKEGFDIKLIILGEGVERKNLETYIEENNLSNIIFLLGHKTDITNYLAAADLLVLLSTSEASNSAVKEAGLVARPAVVCKGVGDFDDYIEDGYNGFVVNPQKSAEELYALLKNTLCQTDKSHLLTMGKNLQDTVLNKFEIKKVINLYKPFFANNT